MLNSRYFSNVPSDLICDIGYERWFGPVWGLNGSTVGGQLKVGHVRLFGVEARFTSNNRR